MSDTNVGTMRRTHTFASGSPPSAGTPDATRTTVGSTLSEKISATSSVASQCMISQRVALTARRTLRHLAVLRRSRFRGLPRTIDTASAPLANRIAATRRSDTASLARAGARGAAAQGCTRAPAPRPKRFRPCSTCLRAAAGATPNLALSSVAVTDWKAAARCGDRAMPLVGAFVLCRPRTL